jgi:hypothetical protein
MGSVRAGEQIRLISSLFLHAIAHFSIWLRFTFFRPVIGYLGSLSFVIVYFGSFVEVNNIIS